MACSDDDRLIGIWLTSKALATQDVYSRAVIQFRREFLGRSLKSITIADMQRFEKLVNSIYTKDSTRRLKINAIKSLFSFAVTHGAIAANPAAILRMPPLNPNLAKKLMLEEEVLRLFAAAIPVRDRLMLQFTYLTGSRVSEVCAVKWEDFVERSDGTVQVNIWRSKSHRLCPVILPGSFWENLLGIKGMGDRVWGLTRQQAHLIIKGAVELAGLDPKISMHWLRHAHARIALEKGADLVVIRDTLGHSNISVTNWYLTSLPDRSSSQMLSV
jgi:integrase/recombinase XerD